MTEKLTREQIDEFKAEGRTFFADQFDALCDMALAWLEVQPRPIEEYNGSSGSVLVYVPGDRWVDAWYSKRNEWWTTDIYGLADKKNEKNFIVTPTHFIPLSSLPEPK